MNEDGSLGIPHDNKENEDTPIAEQSVSVSQENKEEAPENNAPENTNTIDISHESPVEAPAEIKAGRQHERIVSAQTDNSAIADVIKRQILTLIVRIPMCPNSLTTPLL